MCNFCPFVNCFLVVMEFLFVSSSLVFFLCDLMATLSAIFGLLSLLWVCVSMIGFWIMVTMELICNICMPVSGYALYGLQEPFRYSGSIYFGYIVGEAGPWPIWLIAPDWCSGCWSADGQSCVPEQLAMEPMAYWAGAVLLVDR